MRTYTSPTNPETGRVIRLIEVDPSELPAGLSFLVKTSSDGMENAKQVFSVSGGFGDEYFQADDSIPVTELHLLIVSQFYASGEIMIQRFTAEDLFADKGKDGN